MIKIVKKAPDTKKTKLIRIKSVNAGTAWELDFKMLKVNLKEEIERCILQLKRNKLDLKMIKLMEK